jgi:hypothetical protein
MGWFGSLSVSKTSAVRQSGEQKNNAWAMQTQGTEQYKPMNGCHHDITKHMYSV